MFENGIAIITGGESGIGAACAKALGDAGARVVITYFKDEAAAKQVCASIGGASRAMAVQTDVADEEAVGRLFDSAEKEFGIVSLLVNSAGLNMSGVNLVDMELAQFDRVVRSDLYGPFLTCRRFVRALEAKGKNGRSPQALLFADRNGRVRRPRRVSSLATFNTLPYARKSWKTVRSVSASSA